MAKHEHKQTKPDSEPLAPEVINEVAERTFALGPTIKPGELEAFKRFAELAGLKLKEYELGVKGVVFGRKYEVTNSIPGRKIYVDMRK